MKKQKTFKTIKDKFVKVIWHDACSRAAWQDLREIKDWIDNDKGYLCENVGWVIDENKDFIVVCARKTDFDKTYGLCEKLPKKMIREVVLLK